MADSQVLKRLDFPAYCIKLLDNGLIAIAGGGGTSKTGVTNWIEIGHINYNNNTTTNNLNASKFSTEFKLIAKLETDDAIMKFVCFSLDKSNHSTSDFYLAAALNNQIEVYKIQSKINKPPPETLNENEGNNPSDHQPSTVVKRKKSTNSSTATKPNGTTTTAQPIHQSLEAGAELKLVTRIKLHDQDGPSDESIVSLQVHKSHGSSIVLCAGTSTGSIVVWTLQSETNNNLTNKINFEKRHQFKQAHGTSEIDDLQINNDGLLLSIGKDNKCILWSLDKLCKIVELDYTSGLNNDRNLRMKHARFSYDSKFLYTTYIPRVRNGTKNLCSFIQKWTRYEPAATGTFNYRLEKTFKLNQTIITSVQSSKDGYFVSVGDCDGKIYLFDHNFQKIKYFKKSHSSVITDLLFYHDCELTGDNGQVRASSKHATSNGVKPSSAKSNQLTPNNNLRFINDLNKLILSISIDRTVQLYKFINTNNYLLYNLLRPKSNVFVNCCLSMGLFKFIFVLIVFALLFCYFFTYIE